MASTTDQYALFAAHAPEVPGWFVGTYNVPAPTAPVFSEEATDEEREAGNNAFNEAVNTWAWAKEQHRFFEWRFSYAARMSAGMNSLLQSLEKSRDVVKMLKNIGGFDKDDQAKIDALDSELDGGKI